MADVPIDCEFPVWGLMPKKETGVVSFINKYPNHDGRGTVIAILDSGVDPAAAGLQLTSLGETKVIERFDCSGCGDVDTSIATTKVVNSTITGLTGRTLSLPESWKNPKGEWRVGILHPYSLYPLKVRERIQEHRRLNVWDLGHKQAFSKANQDLQDFEKDKLPSTILTPEEKILKEELEARVEILVTAEKKFTDLGPAYDCVLFHDGEVWRACIDTSEVGDLASGPCLGEYSVTHEHSHLTSLDEMTISINVHNKGNTLEVVGMCSTHGTHVASIASGYFPDNPALNGVAPGAKIVSLTIGDGRLGSMETGTALVRACIKIMELSKTVNVDVINMSYGEHAHWANSGRVGDIICEVVNNYGVTWVVSAGNHGPALCTVGAPPDIAQPVLIGVGAYVSGDMTCAAYSMRSRLPSGAFSWSSRGPTCDGAAGVSVCAPGGAVASVARFTLRNAQLMNGTSMAAPHVAGVVSALISGLKSSNIPFSPYSIKRALENSAMYLTHVEPWAQGCGLVNIEKAYELLTQYYADVVERDVTFQITCGAMKGILYRPKIGEDSNEFSVSIEPHFLYEKDLKEDVIEKQIKFGLRLALTCKESWVQIPAHLDMTNTSRTLNIKVNCDGLQPGAHYSEICAYDVNCIEKGPVFRIPVTVLQHETILSTPSNPKFSLTNVEFKQSTVKRHFIMVPQEATWAVLKMSTEATEMNYRFLIHTMQLLPKQSCRTHENQRLISISADSSLNMPFKVLGGVSLELVIAKYWTHVGEVAIDYSLEFRGVRPNFGQCMYFHGAEGVASCNITTLRREDIVPFVQLKYCEPVLRPMDFKLSPLTARDVIPPSRQIYQLVNTYNFHIAKACEVSPIVPLLCDMLYESEVESQMWMMYNSCRQLMGVGDAYPSKYTIKLEKGEYCIKVQFRHESKQVLEKLTDLCVIMQQRLIQPITIDIFSTQTQAITGTKKFQPTALLAGNTMPLYFTAVSTEKTTKSNITIGQLLSGTISFVKDELGRKVDLYEIRYVIPEPPKKTNNNNKDKDKGKILDECTESIRDFKIIWLGKVEGEHMEKMYADLKEEFPTYMGVHVAYLNSADTPSDYKKLPRVGQKPDTTVEFCEKIIQICDTILEEINQDKILAYLGLKNDLRSEAHKIKTEFEKQKLFIIEAFCHRGIALCRLQALGKDNEKERAQNMSDLFKFADFSDIKITPYGIWHCFTQKQWGRAIKLLIRLQDDKPSKEVEERLIEAYKQLGWEYFADYAGKAIPSKFPITYRVF